MSKQNGQDLMIDRRRLLTLTAGGVSATALLRPRRRRPPAFAADNTVRWVSPRGTIEVLDDYPYWVGKKFGYFGDIATTLEPGPSDATATVKLVDQKQADMGYPSPGVFSLALEQGIPLVSVFHMGGSDVFDIAFRKGEKAKEPQGPRGQDDPARQRRLAVDLRSDAVCGRRRREEDQIRRSRLADLGHGAEGRQGRRRALLGRPARAVEGPGSRLRLHPRQGLLEAAGQQLRHPQGRLRGPGEEEALRPLSAGLGGRPRIRQAEPARRDPDRDDAVPGPRVADDPDRRDRSR